VARRNPTLYNPKTPSSRVNLMRHLPAVLRDRRGITVLTLVLLIIVVIVAAVLISRYVAV
jgi:hypothetical protein